MTPLLTALDPIVSGESAIDVPRLNVRSAEDADDFLRAYGFDPDSPAEATRLAELVAEAWAFLEVDLLADRPELTPDPPVRALDAAGLILQASQPLDDDAQRWACAALRVAHVLAHAGSPFKERFGPEIEAQIVGRFQPHLLDGPAGLRLGAGEDAVPLVRFDLRTAKSRRSIARKLLVKAESVAADVFDRIGLRFVTRDRFDALRVVRYLRAHKVIMFANVKPSRSRNTLVDLQALGELMEGAGAGEDLEAWRAATEQAGPPVADDDPDNPHTSGSYRSIQFTCRQLIRVDDMQFFFPFEVQILDAPSFEQSRFGRASHAVYTARQREAALRRVAGALLDSP